MNKLKSLYILIVFVVPFIFITTINILVNIDRLLYIDILLGFIYIIFSNALGRAFMNWLVQHNKTDQVWEWAFNTKSNVMTIFYLVFILASMMLTGIVRVNFM
ncbi:hypothetical protein J2T56_000624 [Natronobacillus azotifigens]|uniref:Uncharacterized protein n=1 Tax=Natronobacillus azotifigens TaxID=472978 RepID=A0A9J6RAH7_9BACI|nr:hypothetical protein [Natronobacillus azotifigens]MCZ0702656.1 hypothetical protein [Natronobacillus azotifigens]